VPASKRGISFWC